MAGKRCSYVLLLLLFVTLLVLMVYLLLSYHHHHGKSQKLDFEKLNLLHQGQTKPQHQQPATRKTKLNTQPESKNTNLRRQKPERERDVNFDAVVSPRGDGSFSTISEAILYAPTYSTTKFYIKVCYGVYNEVVMVPANKTNIVLVGEGADVTKITANRHPPKYLTSNTATFSVLGDGFMAQHITFENSAGGRSGQAVALLCNANNSIFYKCKFLGYQDTVFAKMGTQYYRECDIYGTVDFIFGFATAVFQKCNLYARVLGKYQEITYTAQGRQSLDQASGFTMQGCNFTIDPKIDRSMINTRDVYYITGYLGRPWYPYSTVMVMESFLDKTITSSGWMAWDGNKKNAIYLEYNNWGPGANTTKRVRWSGFKALKDANDAIPYTPQQFIQGDKWIPETGVPYEGGFLFKR